MVLKLYVLLGHHTKLTHTKFCDKIYHILQVMGKNECARHYKSGFSYVYLGIPCINFLIHDLLLSPFQCRNIWMVPVCVCDCMYICMCVYIYIYTCWEYFENNTNNSICPCVYLCWPQAICWIHWFKSPIHLILSSIPCINLLIYDTLLSYIVTYLFSMLSSGYIS